MPSNLDTAGDILKVRKEESFKLAVVKQMEGSRGAFDIYRCISLLLLFFVIVLSFHSPGFLGKLPCLFAFLITCRVNFSFTRENAAGRIRQGEAFWLKYFQHGISIVACDFEHCETFVCLAFFPCFSQPFSISQAGDGKRENPLQH